MYRINHHVFTDITTSFLHVKNILSQYTTLIYARIAFNVQITRPRVNTGMVRTARLRHFSQHNVLQ